MIQSAETLLAMSLLSCAAGLWGVLCISLAILVPEASMLGLRKTCPQQ
ncbi:hypothetical protein Cadr_000031294 [Camelus dromedarius]|uniref:Uncharacterized protein n=1 Tax=Camelus dromedarius TaxID=9838 RepID=A0A5N4BWX4_CAMDR|nr:hypothetical protein Cadr_000031293 [Camelus dromedarius]KAB1251169.1 hypothetical protein Cadr_000031294 [Camelus dromedarius]